MNSKTARTVAIATVSLTVLMVAVVFVNTQLFHMAATSRDFPVALRYVALAGLVFLASVPVSYLLGRRGWERARDYYSFWDYYIAALGFLVVILAFACIMMLPGDNDRVVNGRLHRQPAIELSLATATAPAPAAARQLAFAQANVFARTGRYSSDVRQLTVAPNGRALSRLREVLSLAVAPNGRTWIAQLTNGWSVTQTRGYAVVAAKAALTPPAQ